MRSSIIAALAAAAAQAARVHEFFAENNYICGLCKSAVEMGTRDEIDALGELYDQFPALQTRINYWAQNPEVIDLSSPVETCQRM